MDTRRARLLFLHAVGIERRKDGLPGEKIDTHSFCRHLHEPTRVTKHKKQGSRPPPNSGHPPFVNKDKTGYA